MFGSKTSDVPLVVGSGACKCLDVHLVLTKNVPVLLGGTPDGHLLIGRKSGNGRAQLRSGCDFSLPASRGHSVLDSVLVLLRDSSERVIVLLANFLQFLLMLSLERLHLRREHILDGLSSLNKDLLVPLDFLQLASQLLLGRSKLRLE